MKGEERTFFLIISFVNLDFPPIQANGDFKALVKVCIMHLQLLK